MRSLKNFQKLLLKLFIYTFIYIYLLTKIIIIHVVNFFQVSVPIYKKCFEFQQLTELIQLKRSR
jgi:hypothetical protein